MKKKSLRPLPKLKADAWKIFSVYIRLRDKGKCFTCDFKNNYKSQQAGHFKHNRLDYDEMNINCQCPRCNKWLHGNLGEYAIRLIKKYGQEAVDDLIFRANQIKKYSRQELEEIISIYKDKVKNLIEHD